MMSRSTLNMDKYEVCKGLIMPQSIFMVCSECNHVAHRKCAKLMFEFNHLENLWMCHQCTNNKVKRYNIFKHANYFDKHDPNSLHDVDDLHELSEILNNCEIMTLNDLITYLTVYILQIILIFLAYVIISMAMLATSISLLR